MTRKEDFKLHGEELNRREKSLASERKNELQSYDEQIREEELKLFEIDKEWQRELASIEESEKNELKLLEEEKKRLLMEVELLRHKGGNRFTPKSNRASRGSQTEQEIDDIVNTDDDGLGL